MEQFYKTLPKVELHAHLNGSLSHATMLELKRHNADHGIVDKTNSFFDEFQIGEGDTRKLSDCFQVFNIAHSLTNTPEALFIATSMTLKEFQDDGCYYIELRSTPRHTPHMTKRQYIEAIVQAMLKSSQELTIISRLIISIDRRSAISVADDIANLAIEYHQKFPSIVIGIELSGDPTKGTFKDYRHILWKARDGGLKVSLHCGEVCNPEEVYEMLKFKPDRVGHCVCIHPRLGGTQETWAALCESKIPVEICLTSNVNTRLVPDYELHHFKELYEAKVPVIICTDDKGVFATSLTQEYRLCAENFNLKPMQIAKIALRACDYIFDENEKENLKNKVLNFINESSVCIVKD